MGCWIVLVAMKIYKVLRWMPVLICTYRKTADTSGRVGRIIERLRMAQVIKNPNCIDDWVASINSRIALAQQHLLVEDNIDRDFLVSILNDAMGLLLTMNERFKGTLGKDGTK